MNDSNHNAPIPVGVREAVLRRAKGHCEECGGVAPLELHHLTYLSQQPADQYKFPKYARPIFGLERPEDLQALCRDCHYARLIGPDGEFYADPEECEEAEREYFNDVLNNDD
jgi:5-methylcytosine-specific restriction endonuclease McrA